MKKGIVNTGLKSTSITKNLSSTKQLPSSNNSSTRLKVSAAKDSQEVSINSGTKDLTKNWFGKMLQRSQNCQLNSHMNDNLLDNLFLILILDLAYEILIKGDF